MTLRRLALVSALAAATCGCNQRMKEQPRADTFKPSGFFADGRSARALVPGTVPRGALEADALLYEGRQDGAPATAFPFAVDAAVMARGESRYRIYCTPCHGQAGMGDGMIVARGFRVPPSFHVERLTGASVGYLFGAISRGLGMMPAFGKRIPAADRWAIVAYIRALQESQHADVKSLDAAERARLEAVR